MRAWKKSKLMRNFFQKSNFMIAVSYIMKRKIKKIFFEVISNSKIFNIIFSTKLSTTKIFPNLQGTRQRGGGLDNVEFGNTKVTKFMWISDHFFVDYWTMMYIIGHNSIILFKINIILCFPVLLQSINIILFT